MMVLDISKCFDSSSCVQQADRVELEWCFLSGGVDVAL